MRSESGDASLPIEPAAADATIRPATRGDLDALLGLEASFSGDRLSRRAFRYHLASPRARCLVAESDTAIVGYALLLARADSRWWRLYSLVRDERAPPGTGRRLLAAALALSRAAGARGVRLEVRADNARAIRLYRDLGFALFATVDGYYEDGAAALRMALGFAD